MGQAAIGDDLSVSTPGELNEASPNHRVIDNRQQRQENLIDAWRNTPNCSGCGTQIVSVPESVKQKLVAELQRLLSHGGCQIERYAGTQRCVAHDLGQKPAFKSPISIGATHRDDFRSE